MKGWEGQDFRTFGQIWGIKFHICQGQGFRKKCAILVSTNRSRGTVQRPTQQSQLLVSHFGHQLAARCHCGDALLSFYTFYWAFLLCISQTEKILNFKSEIQNIKLTISSIDFCRLFVADIMCTIYTVKNFMTHCSIVVLTTIKNNKSITTGPATACF